MGNLKLGGMCKCRIAHVTRFLFTQGYVTWLGTSLSRASLPASKGLVMTQPYREQSQCALTAALLVCHWLTRLTCLEKGDTSMEYRICGKSIVSMPNSCRAPMGKHVCYSSIKCSKQPPHRINKQGGIADIKPGHCVPYSLQKCFHLGKGGSDITGKCNTVAFHCLNHRNLHYPEQNFRKRHHDPSSCA